jgi:ribose transport system permease protein
MQTPGDARPASMSERARRRFAAVRPDNLIVYLGFLAVVVFFAVVLQDRGFLTADNFANIARQTAMVSIMAFGMTFVLSAGEIDLSIGSIVALSAMVVAILLRETNLVIAVLGALAVGLIIGLVNGLLTTRLRIPSFLVTLGMLSIVVGLARITTDLEPVPVVDETFAFLFGSGSIGPVPILLVWTAAFLVGFHILLRRTPFGRQVLATGGNKIAAGYSGINTDRIKIAVLMMSAGTAAVAGMLYAGRLQGARYTLGEADLLTVIAATVIGGTSMFGGKGSIVGALFGSLLMGVLNNGLLLMGLTVSEQLVARGVIIIAAVALSLREARA